MLLYIVRHAWAEERDPLRYSDDSLRPLTKEGRARFVAVAKKLAQRGVAPDLIATSPYLRCRQTAEILAKRMSPEVAIVESEFLAPGGSLPKLLEWTSRQEKKSVAWVGHAPDVEQCVARLIGRGRSQIRMPKGSAAAIEFSEQPAVGKGVLRWLVTAKMLDC